MRRESRLWDLAGAVALAPCLFFPISNPDLFWHLSAARRMLELKALPSADWLSSTMAGRPWEDFEWLPQLLYGALHAWGGLAALWLLKLLLLAAAAAALVACLRLYGTPAPWRAAALALWGAAHLVRSDARPDLFSVLLFSLLFLYLEARRLRRLEPPAAWREPAAAAAFFSLWANLHPGFPYGLVLLAAYAAAISLEPLLSPRPGQRGLWPAVAAAAAGGFLQPFGPALHRVLWRHWTELGSLSAYITEWGSIRLENPWHWPYWALLFLCLGAALAALRRRRFLPLGPLSALLFCAFSASRHTRLAAYYAVLAAPLSACFLGEAGLLGETGRPRGRTVAGAAVALCALFSLLCGGSYGLFTRVFNERFIPVRATAFLEREAATLGGRALYNPWGWGGYLGWRLHPRYQVFQDGRYIFHPLLEEAGAATASPAAWQGFLDRHRVEVALLENLPLMLETARPHADGSSSGARRPYYALYMPRERWALVHWDGKALVFARRSAFPSVWTRQREFRWARPFDDAALAESLRSGEVRPAELETERRRLAAGE